VDLREQGEIDANGHWYYESKFDLIFGHWTNAINPQTIIEIGAGSKFFIKKLLDKHPNAKGLAIDPNFNADQIVSEPRLTSYVKLPEAQGDLYLFLDVLEHVDNERQLIQESLKHAETNATIVFSVPAFKHLWSGHDIFLGHYRRYRKSQLISVLDDCGLEIQRIYYAFSLIYPIALLKRRIIGKKIESQMRALPKNQNNLLIWTLRKLCKMNKNNYFGISLIAIAKKTSNSPRVKL
jgi:hypothetical protein